MKRIPQIIMLLCLLGVVSIGMGARTIIIESDLPEWGANPGFSMFYEVLLPYGEWVWVANYGWVWSPYDVPIGWRPYTYGHWVITDYGWTWVAYEPWGWVCFHYGRWFYHDTYGWLWYPGTVWAPAWVCWRVGDGYIGWAPLPPRLRWRTGIGFEVTGVNLNVLIPPHAFCFVYETHIFEPRIHRHIIHPARHITFFTRTKPMLEYKEKGRRIINRMPDETRIERVIGKPVPRVKLVEADSPKEIKLKDNELRLFMPDIKKIKDPEKLKIWDEKPLKKEIPDLKLKREKDFEEFEKLKQQKLRWLEEQQKEELKQPPKNIKLDEIKKRHDAERKAFEEELERERKLLRNWQEREEKIKVLPESTPRRKFKLDEPGWDYEMKVPDIKQPEWISPEKKLMPRPEGKPPLSIPDEKKHSRQSEQKQGEW